MSIKKRITTLILCLALSFTIGGEILLSAFCVKAEAATSSSYSNVLDDLQKDSSFDPADYPENPSDYSLKVMQIAEGESGDVFVYIYQPNFKQTGLTADYINIAFQDQRDSSQVLKYSKKALRFLNSEGTICKYVISDYKVSSETIRYYSVSAVYRRFIDGVDTTYEAIENVQYHGIPVGKMWSACLYNGTLQYAAYSINIVPVEITVSGEIFYPKNYSIFPGFISSGTAISSHYIAFKVDGYDITNIFDVDVTYRLCHYHTSFSGMEYIKIEGDDIYEESKTLYSVEHVDVEYDGIFDKKYTWNRIETVDKFKEGLSSASKELPESDLADIDKAQFVIRIAETEYKATTDGTTIREDFYAMEEGGILRLHFATPYGVYNLGAVSDLVGTDGKNNASKDIDFEEWFEKILSAIMFLIFIVILFVLWGPIKLILDIVWTGIKLVLSILLSILTLPFNLLGWFFKQK